jgi:hypothetical protein
MTLAFSSSAGPAPASTQSKPPSKRRAYDPFYVPIYLRVSIWLNGKHPRQEGAPKPGAWLTKILKPDRADPEPVRRKKIITSAQTIGLLPAHPQLDPQDLDWPTLKVGLFQMARTHKSSLDWPSRCLVAAYAFQDAEAAKEALELIQGNYSRQFFITRPRSCAECVRTSMSVNDSPRST